MRSLIRSLCISGLLAATVVVVGCSNKITDEQMQQIKELQRREASLNDEIGKRQRDVSQLQSEVNARNSDMNKCTEKRTFVQNKLSSWPNVWPDYTEQTAPVQTDTVRTTPPSSRRPR